MDIERRLAFLLSLGDKLRGLTRPDAIKAAAAEALGFQLGAARVGYGEIDLSGTRISTVPRLGCGRTSYQSQV